MQAEGYTMKCPACQGDKTKVTETRKDHVQLEHHALQSIRRQRTCPDCSWSFWTAELAEEDWKILQRLENPPPRRDPKHRILPRHWPHI